MPQKSKSCPDCGVQPGSLHRPGCDLEQCPNCGRQSISCGCTNDQIVVRLPWPGEWPGVLECRAFAWYAKLVPGVGWMPCGPEEPGAAEDLNRLHLEAEWDPLEMRFIPRAEEGS
jgi:hypothetical protein